MTSVPPPAAPAPGLPRRVSMRRRLFVSHIVVMVVAIVVLAVVVTAIIALGEARMLGPGSRGNGPAALALAGTAAAIAAGLVSWWVTRRLASPMEEIGAVTRDLAAGRYERRAPAADTVELDALADDVNHLAHELRTTEDRRLRLIGDVAHELRNPLSTIQGTMEALLDGVVAADDETYARIGREAARLRRLADDLSALSAAGERDLVRNQSVDLAQVTADVVEQLQPQSAAKELELGLYLEPVPLVEGDADRLAQVMMNVVGNAVQYTDTGSVDVHLGRAGPTVVIEVTDTGRGLAPEDQTRIFERFHRVDEHFTDGTGVGLAIARLLVEAHSGTISASSPGLGAGTTVRIELPANASAR
ncbi:MAG: HAMP domain-containing sensor histidine kinase [Actinomycetota bacterium]